jgi:hypothetical protein
MFNEQTNAHFINSSLFTVRYLSLLHVSPPTRHPQGTIILPAVLRKRVHTVLLCFLRNLHIRFLESLKTLKY